MHSAQARALAGAPSTSGRAHTPCQAAALSACGRPARRTATPWCLAAAAASGRLVTARAAEPAAPNAASPADEWVEVGRIGPPHGVRGEMKVQPLTDFPEDRLATPGARWVQAPVPKIGRRQAAPPEEVELEWGRSMISKGNEVWLVKLVEVESPEEAALLRGHSLLIPASAREALENEDEFYVQDLVGLHVVLQATGEEVGTVSDVFDGTGTHDVLRIQLAPAKLAQLAAAAAASSSEEEEEEEEEAEEGEAGSSSSGGSGGGGSAGAGGGGGGQRHVLLPFAKAMVPVVDLAARRMEITPPEGLLELAAPSNMRTTRRENRGRRDRLRPRPRRGINGIAAGPAAQASSDAE